MLIVFPLGLLPMATLADIAYFVSKRGFWAEAAFWLIAAGVIGGIIAAIFGTIDWLSIPARTRAKRIGTLHAAMNVVVLALFSASWVMRKPQPTEVPVIACVLGVIALALAIVSGWFGAELIYRLGIGVDDTAHPNASNSVTQDAPPAA
jgi:uncharacterized membrane protein